MTNPPTPDAHASAPSSRRLNTLGRDWPALAALLVFAVFAWRFGDYIFDVGGTKAPLAKHMAFLAQYTALGGVGVLFATMAVRAWLDSPGGQARVARQGKGSERRFVILASVAALVLPTLVRVLVLDSAPLTDDEDAYRFSSELLSQGMLWTDSPDLKIFFDRSLMINDGRFYTQYFLGWPALMLPFTLLGLEAWASAFFFAATVPAFYWLLRAFVRPIWAKLGVLILLSSPLLVITAATMLSHSACVCFLVWSAFALVRARKDTKRARWHGLFGLFFAIAFFVRPQSAIGVAAALPVAWVISLRPLASASRRRALLAFAAATLPLALLFLLINWLQNGSVTEVAYSRVVSYSEENLFRFTHIVETHAVHNFNFADLPKAVQTNGYALLRFNVASMGWPLAFVLAPFALGARRTGLWLSGVLVPAFFYFFLSSTGVDVIGPVHLTEIVIPVIGLTVIGGQRLSHILAEGARVSTRWRSHARLPAALIVASVMASTFLYWPVRLRTLSAVADNTNKPRDAVRAANLDNAVIFVERPYIVPCDLRRSAIMVFWPPINDPEFKNSVIYVNHVTHADDLLFLRSQYPERRGYLMNWSPQCEVGLVPIEKINPAELRDALPGGLAGQPDAKALGWRPEMAKP